jgi:hypothetical protein
VVLRVFRVGDVRGIVKVLLGHGSLLVKPLLLPFFN